MRRGKRRGRKIKQNRTGSYWLKGVLSKVRSMFKFRLFQPLFLISTLTRLFIFVDASGLAFPSARSVSRGRFWGFRMSCTFSTIASYSPRVNPLGVSQTKFLSTRIGGLGVLSLQNKLKSRYTKIARINPEPLKSIAQVFHKTIKKATGVAHVF